MTQNRHISSLDRMLNPQSVAIIGASDDGSRLSGRPLRYIRKAGYAGRIYPVNPKRDVVQGLRSYRSIAELPEAPDVAIITISSKLVLTAVSECAEVGVGAIILFSSGFAESGEEGRIEQQKILGICHERGIRLLGPNCLGVFNSKIGFFGTFATSLDRSFPRSGNVAIVSQSGAFGQHVSYLMTLRGVGISYLITTGNEADVSLDDALSWAASQADIDVIALYVEGIRSGNGFVEAMELARRNKKRVVCMKVGSSATGSHAVSSHTAALAGDDAIFDCVLRQYGTHRVRTIEEMVDVTYACAMGRLPKSRRMGVITLSGGFGIHICDMAEISGLELPALGKDVQENLLKILPYASVSNPVDCTGQAVNELHALAGAMKLLLSEESIDGLFCYFGTVPLTEAGISKALRSAVLEGTRECHDKPIILCMLADQQELRSYEEAHLLVFEDPARAVTAMAAMAKLKESEQARDSAGLTLAKPLEIPRRPLSEYEASRILLEAGVPVVAQTCVATKIDCIDAAKRFGFPVVLKLVSAQLQHKSKIGGVILNIGDVAALTKAYDELWRRGSAVSDATIDGILVMPMAPPGIETIIGVIRDPIFGPTVMFGLGGVFVESLRDITLRRAPFGEEEANRMIREIAGYRLLEGTPGKASYDVTALANVLSRVSVFAAANADQIQSLDINPFVVWEVGKGGIALDALIVSGKNMTSEVGQVVPIPETAA